MFDRLKPTVYTLLHTLLGLKMTSTWLPVVLPALPEPIQPYCQRLALMKMGDGIEQLRKWRVISVKAYKSKATSRHEYVSATVVDPDNKHRYVAIERGRGDPDPLPFSINPANIDPQPNRLFSTSNPSTSSFSSTSSPSDISSPTRGADDKISPLTAPGKRKKDDEIIYELHFEKTPLYLYQLAFLALTVHDANKSYLLITNNCYHYTGTIIKVLEGAYNLSNTADGAAAGKWCGIAIYSNKGSIDSLLVNFRQEIKNFVSSIPD
jgi:hypothetical protein